MARNAIYPMLLAAALAAPLSARALQCGVPISVSVSLATDLVCTSGDGVVVGADNLRIDLNGFSILGAGIAGAAGVRSSGFSGIKVVGPGRIAAFEISLAIDGGRFHEIRDVDVADISPPGSPGAAIWMRNTRDSVIEKSRIGVARIEADPYLAATGNRIAGNDAAGVQLYGCNASYNDVTGNNMSGVSTPGVVVVSGLGNRIYGNNMYGHVYLGSARQTLVEANTIMSPGPGGWIWTGVLMEDGPAYIARCPGPGPFPARDNVVRANGILGGHYGVHMARGAIKNKIMDNKIDGTGTGLYFAFGADDNEARGNWLSNVAVPMDDWGRGNLWP